MNLLFDCLVDNYQTITKPAVSKEMQRSQSLKRRKTRRSKRKKTKSAKWTKEFNEAMKLHKQMKKERANDFRNFARLIEKE